MSDNLWPAEFEIVKRAPVAVLREQAARLAERTKKLVLADVQISPSDLNRPGPGFFLELRIVAPTLDYTYSVLTFWQPVDIAYPLILCAAPWPLTNLAQRNYFGYGWESIDNEDQFLAVMQKAFNHDKVKAVIGNLIANVQALAS